jgi:hypothetical protein
MAYVLEIHEYGDIEKGALLFASPAVIRRSFGLHSAAVANLNISLFLWQLFAKHRRYHCPHALRVCVPVGVIGEIFNPTKWKSPKTYKGPPGDTEGQPAVFEGIVADKFGKITIKDSVAANFTLNGWDSIIGRSCTLVHAVTRRRVTGIIAVSKFDPEVRTCCQTARAPFAPEPFRV